MKTVTNMGFMEYLKKYPHNTDCSDKFMDLIEYAYHLDNTGLSLEEFIDKCLYHYGGTVAEAVIDYIINHS